MALDYGRYAGAGNAYVATVKEVERVVPNIPLAQAKDLIAQSIVEAIKQFGGAGAGGTPLTVTKQELDADNNVYLVTLSDGSVLRLPVGSGGGAALSVTSKVETTDGVKLTLSDGTVLNLPYGRDGSNGANGDSAYSLAVKNGFSGTEVEWLESLKSAAATAPEVVAVTQEQAVAIQDILTRGAVQSAADVDLLKLITGGRKITFTLADVLKASELVTAYNNPGEIIPLDLSKVTTSGVTPVSGGIQIVSDVDGGRNVSLWQALSTPFAVGSYKYSMDVTLPAGEMTAFNFGYAAGKSNKHSLAVGDNRIEGAFEITEQEANTANFRLWVKTLTLTNLVISKVA